MIPLFIWPTSCIQVFDYKPKDSGERMLVVDGGITSQPEKQYIRLSRSAPYGTGEYYPESGAMVYILENGNVVIEGDAGDLLKDEHVRKAYLGG